MPTPSTSTQRSVQRTSTRRVTPVTTAAEPKPAPWVSLTTLLCIVLVSTVLLLWMSHSMASSRSFTDAAKLQWDLAHHFESIGIHTSNIRVDQTHGSELFITIVGTPLTKAIALEQQRRAHEAARVAAQCIAGDGYTSIRVSFTDAKEYRPELYYSRGEAYSFNLQKLLHES